MKVVHIVAGKVFGGVETHLVTLARFRKLCPEMQTHFGVCYPGRLSEELKATGAPVHVLGAAHVSQPWTIWQARKRLRDVLAEEKIDVVICHMTWTQAVFGPAAHSMKCRSVIFLQNPVAGRHWTDLWARSATPDLVLAVSKDTARSSGKVYPDTACRVVYSPMPQFESHARAEARPLVRRELFTPDEATVFIQASRMDTWKGHHILLEALGRLRDEPGWVLWIAGAPQTAAEQVYLDELQSIVARLGIKERIQFLGQRRDVPRLMAAADVFCQANTGSEGFSWAFMEACSASLPIVTSAIGGAPEIVDETNGNLVAPNDVDALAAALREYVGNPERCRVMGAAGYRRVHQMCDRERQIRKLHEILASLPSATEVLQPT